MNELTDILEDEYTDKAIDAVYEYLNDNYEKYNDEDIDYYVSSVSGDMKDTVHGTKDLDLEVSTDRGIPEVVGKIDGNEVARSEASLDVQMNVDSDNLEAYYEDSYHDEPSYDASIGGFLPDAVKDGETAILSGELLLDAEVSINREKFLAENKDALKEAGFEMTREAEKELL